MDNDGTAQFDFYPDYSQAGIYTVLFYAYDGIEADSEYVEITVFEQNGPPVLTYIGPHTVLEGDSLGIQLSAFDPEGDDLQFGAYNLPENAYLVDNGDGTGLFNFLPGYTQAGIYNVGIFVSDGIAIDSEEVEVTVVEAGNQSPRFDSADSVYSVVEGDSLNILITAYDVDGDPINFIFSSIPFNSGYIEPSPDTALFYFTPAFGQAGNYVFQVEISDGSLNNIKNFYLEVLDAGDQPPVFDPVDSQFVYEGDTLIVNVTAIDPDGTIPPVITVSNQHLHSDFVDNGDGTATYTYMPDYYDANIDTVIFIAIDSDDLQDVLEVEITTLEFNIPPDLFYEGDSVAIQGETLEALLIATDSTDNNGGPIYLSTLYLPENAQFIDNGDYTGTFTFTPDYDQVGLDSVIFVAADSDNPPMSSSITVHLEIRNQNRPPILEPLGSYEIDQAETLTVALSATDPDGDPIILRLAGNPSPPRNCHVTDNGDGTGELYFAPDYTQSGVFIINVEAYDLLDSDVQSAFVFVADLGNQTPTLNPISDMSLIEGDTIEVEITSTDPDSTYPAIVIENAPYRVEFTDHGDGTATFYFEPLFNQSGNYQMLFMAIDSDSAVDSQYVNLDVIEAGNQYPENNELWFNIYADDPDSSIPHLVAENMPENAAFEDSLNGVGHFTFNPSYYQAGEYTVLFKAIDSEDSSFVDSGFVNITVINVNLVPEIDPIGPFTVFENDSLGFLITAFDADSTYPILTQTIEVMNSSFHDSGNGVGYFSFEPDYFQSGSEFVGFMAVDSEDSTAYDDILIQIDIINVNRPPVLDPLPADTSVQDGVYFTLEISAADSDLVVPELFAHNLPENSSFIDHEDGTGTFNFNPEFGDLGEYFVTFGAVDGQYPSSADSQTVRIEVISTNMHPPQFDSMATEYHTVPDTLLYIEMEAVDPDNDSLIFSHIEELPEGAVFIDMGNGTASFSWIPDSSQAGEHAIRFVVTDTTNLSDTLLIEIEVITWIRGDANGSGGLTNADVTYLIAYFMGNVPRPYPTGRGDANGDGFITGGDVTYLVNYFFVFGGPPPPPPPSPPGEPGNDRDSEILSSPNRSILIRGR